MDEDLVSCSGKMKLLDRIIPKLRDEGHKVRNSDYTCNVIYQPRHFLPQILIFSQMTKMLDILQDYCWLRHYGYCRLDGSVGFAEREAQISSFNKDADKFLFLISTRAGGLGLNLMAADTVILYDSDWVSWETKSELFTQSC